MGSTKKHKGEGFILFIIRILVALVFIFSSFVKGVDVLGTAYRVEDYLEAYGWYMLVDYSMFISYLLIIVEFLLGFALMFRLQAKLTALGVLLIMAFFTVVTYFDAKYNMVPDCGCFGDAIKLDNWETFYKNIVLIVMALILFIWRKKMVLHKPDWVQNLILILFGGLFAFFVNYNYNHLPMLDFRDWKVGNDMKSANLDLAKTYVIYKNKATGEIQEYESTNYPWRDSVWMSQWEFVDQRYDDSQVTLKHHLIIQDTLGNNYNADIIENPDEQLILVVYDLDEANEKGMSLAAELFESAEEEMVSFVMLTASSPQTVKKYEEFYDINYPYYLADDIELKAMIRSNPGLFLLKNGIILNKWHYNDFPVTMDAARKN